ncbi:MAG: C4-dicarboxylate ABC transporter substrate-binding protein, partial [Roseovarius sp.]|nr:C4-dicarboxylate ABC transporter substrate-binding protein [Roseovarius sp.]
MLRLVDKLAEGIAILCFVVSSGFIFLNVLNRYLVLGLMRDWAKDYEGLRPAYFAVRDVLG